MKLWPFARKSITHIADDDGALLSAFTGSTPGAGVTARNALTVPAVAAAVRLISEACATLDINIVEGDKPVSDHPALTLLRGQVSEWASGYEFIRDLVAEALLHDSGAMAWVNRPNGAPVEIINYQRGAIAVQYEETRQPIYRLNGRPEPASNIIHLRGPFEKCPISLAREAIGAAMVMEAHASRLFRNGARPGGVVSIPKGMGEDAIKRMRSSFRAANEGPEKAGQTMFVYDGATFTEMQLKSTDSEFLLNRRFQIEEIARAFGMSASQLGDLTKSSYANAAHKSLELLTFTIDPWLCALESALGRALLTDEERKTHCFRIDRDDLSRADLQTRAAAISSLIASETISPNEGRSWIGYGPYDGGEKFGNRNITVKPAKADPGSEDQTDGE